MLLPRPSSVQGSASRGRALSAASCLTDAMEGEKRREKKINKTNSYEKPKFSNNGDGGGLISRRCLS